jgi:hypothetical protein
MPRITGPRLLGAVLVLLYGAFWIWYGGAGGRFHPKRSTIISSCSTGARKKATRWGFARRWKPGRGPTTGANS